MLVLYESRDSCASIIPMWSGVGPFIASGLKIYADYEYSYLVGLYDITGLRLGRFTTSMPGIYNYDDVTPPQTTSGVDRTGSMVHYMSEWGFAMYSAFTWTTSGSHLYAQTYPEIAGAWQDFGALPQSAIDVVFPDTPDSPRFVLGFGGNTPEKVYVILAQTSGLVGRYATVWTPPLLSGSAVTDLEVTRFI